MRHPNVVQFIGVHYGRDQDDLTLVMEGLYMDLDRCLKHVSVRGVPLALPVKLAILLDVAYGLLYLHTQNPPIVHRDLTASNILLTNDLRAKLADLGVSKILDLHPRSQATQTTCPGTLGAMPPEALIEMPIYDAKLDVFSFGTVMLHVVNQEFPIFYDVDRYERGEKHIAMRRRAISKMGETHVLCPLVLRCLQDDPQRRPPTAEVRASLERLARDHPKQFKDVIEMYTAMEDMRKELNELQSEMHMLKSTLTERESETNTLKSTLTERESETNTLKSTLTERESEIEQVKGERRKLHRTLGAQRGRMAELTMALQERESEVQRLEAKNTELWKGVGLHRKNMSCVQPVVSELSRTVGEVELERHRLTVALAEQERELERLKKEKELSAEVELERHRLTVALAEQEREVERLKKEKEMSAEVELERHRLTVALAEQEREVERLKKEKEMSAEVELERHRLTVALAEQGREVERLKKEKELSAEVELERHRLTVAWDEQVGEVERLKKEKKELQEAMEARQSHTQLSPEVAKLSETLSEWDSGLQELVCNVNAPRYQREEITVLLKQRLMKGDTWYLVDVRWMKQWRKYVGYDQQDQSSAGLDSAHPGPIDNSNLFKDRAGGALKNRLMEGRNYSLLPEPAWLKMLAWFGLSKGSRPIARKVVAYMKHSSQITEDTHQVDIHDIVQLSTMRLSAPYTWLEEGRINREVKLCSGQQQQLNEQRLELHRDRDPWLELFQDHWLEPHDDQWLEPHNKLQALLCYAEAHSSRPQGAETHMTLQQYDDQWLVAHYKVEVYRLEFLALMYNSKKLFTGQMSRCSTVADLEAQLRSMFSVPQEVECRVWHRYSRKPNFGFSSRAFQQMFRMFSRSTTVFLTIPRTKTLLEVGLHNGSAIVLEKRNEDGSWPVKTTKYLPDR